MSIEVPASSFVGRERDLEALARLLAARRLVTISGGPGMGKTRLALRYAQLHGGPSRPGGVRFVALAEARSHEDVVAAVARAVGAPCEGGPAERAVAVGAALHGQGPILLILDNFEQLVEHAQATVGVWLATAAKARFLVTSREILRLPGEVVIDLPPLPVPAARHRSCDEILRSEAVQLLLHRAAGYHVRGSEEVVLAEIVRQLDGIPLAIELAATRLKMLGSQELLERLPRRFQLLTRGARHASSRQATLVGAIDWSWRLLPPAEQVALATCSVFRGGFSLEAAERVLARAGGPSVLDVLQSLCEKSLVTTYAPARLPGQVRFQLYESIRAYATEKLSPHRRRQAATRLVDHYARFAQAWAARLGGGGAQEALERLVLERENLVVAFEHAVAGPRAATAKVSAARLALALDQVLARHGASKAHVELLDAAIAACDRRTAARLHAHLLAARGRARRYGGEIEASLADYRAARSIARRVRDRKLEALVLGGLGRDAQLQGRLPEAKRLLEDALSLLEGDPDPRAEETLRSYLGTLERIRGDERRAAAHFDRALAIGRQLPDQTIQARARSNLAMLCLRERPAQARAHWEEALAIQRDIGDRWGEAISLTNLAVVAQEEGRLTEAAARYVEALARCQEVGQRQVECCVLSNLGGLRAEEGRHDDAKALHRQSLAVARQVRDRRMEGYVQARLVLLAHLLDCDRPIVIYRCDETARVEEARSRVDGLS